MDTHDKLQKHILILYYLYASSVIFQLSGWTATLGIILNTVAIIFTYIKRKSCAHTPYQSHIVWLLRTFWLGTGLFLPIAAVIATFITFQFGDFMMIIDTIYSGQLGSEADLIQLLKDYVSEHRLLLITVCITCFGPILVWWVWRCWVGFKKAQKAEPIDTPKAWF